MENKLSIKSDFSNLRRQKLIEHLCKIEKAFWFPPLTPQQKKDIWVAKMLRTRRINKHWHLRLWHRALFPFYMYKLRTFRYLVIRPFRWAIRWLRKWEIRIVDTENEENY